MRHWLLQVIACADVPPEAVACVHRALQRLPEPLSRLIYDHNVSVAVRASFPWSEETYHRGLRWKDCGGGYETKGRYLLLNASWMKDQGCWDAVLYHEIGHALGDRAFGRAYNAPEFRKAWSAGRKRVASVWPEDYAARQHMGVYCGHWTQAVQEVWAESIPWMMGARSATHSAFGETFTECVESVRDTLASADITFLT